MLLVLAAILSLGIGGILGLLGGGGSILTLPMLVYLLGMDGKQGIASSLFVVAVTSAVAAISHARLGKVRWRIGLLFGGVGMAASFLAGSLARWVQANVLLVAFGLVMLATAVSMMRGRPAGSSRGTPLSPTKVAGMGGFVGTISGLVGAGGGFLIVPALSLFGGLAMGEAIGTSLFVIAVQAFAGFAGHATYVHMDWGILVVITSASVTGSLLGSKVSGRLSPSALRLGFAWLVLSMGIFVVGNEVVRGEMAEKETVQTKSEQKGI